MLQAYIILVLVSKIIDIGNYYFDYEMKKYIREIKY